MRYMIDRINTLLIAINLPPVRNLNLQPSYMDGDHTILSHRSMTPTHDLLDLIDRHVGIITRTTFRTKQPAPVGERVRRLERHIGARELPPYFWLGAEAENLQVAAPA